MQLLGRLFEHVLIEEDRWLNVLGATSGDTGSAAEYAMRGKRNLRIFMLSPDRRMSRFQRAQMYSLRDPNVFNIAVAGIFDDCQDLVKAVSEDLAFKARHSIGTVNSINWARVVAQVVYYFKGYFAATTSNDQRVSFAVPTGNFGNVLAAHIARMMGLPIARLVVATNENDVLDEFFKTGRYRVRSHAQTHETSSPSMDISKASNFERFVFDLLDGDAGRVASLWEMVRAHGEFDLGGTREFHRAEAWGFRSGSSSHAAAHRHHPSLARQGIDRRRHAHRRRTRGGGTLSGSRRADDLHGDGAAGQVRAQHPRSDRRGAGAAAGVPRPRVDGAAVHADAG